MTLGQTFVRLNFSAFLNFGRTFLFFAMLSASACGGSGGGSASGSGTSGLGNSSCDGSCANISLSENDVRIILSQAVQASTALSKPAVFSITDRVGNVLAVYQMPGASSASIITGRIGAQGGLEGLSVPASLAAISKAGTGSYLSSQGNAFSTRTASFIIQENFAPGQHNAPGGPLFGVQFSQLPCSDIKDSVLGPRPLPLGLSADPGGIPLYKDGDIVGGLGVELDGIYSFDTNIEDYDDSPEEKIALAAAHGYEAPVNRVADAISVGGQSLRFSDISYTEAAVLLSSPSTADNFLESELVSASVFNSGNIQGSKTFGSIESGIINTVRAGAPAGYLVRSDGSPRFPTRSGSSISGADALSAFEVDALLDSALITASRLRAAIRQPLNTPARVSIFVVDTQGIPLGFIRSQDAPVFGIDVALQKARTAAFFSSADANEKLTQAGFGGYVQNTASLFDEAFNGSHAFSNRSIGNLARPFFPDGINGSSPGPLSLPFPGIATGKSWSPFDTGLQLDLVLAGIAAPLSGSIPSSCSSAIFERRLGNGMQIFSGSVPLYRNGMLVGAIGISGDGIFQDDMVAFFSASRQGLNFVGHSAIGDPELGFNAPKSLRSDTIELTLPDARLRYVNCPESPFIDGSDQNICAGL